MKFCQNCTFFDQPKCKKYDTFMARKNQCDDFILNKNKKIQIPEQKIEVKESDADLKKKIFGEKTEIPEKRKFKRSKKQRRK